MLPEPTADVDALEGDLELIEPEYRPMPPKRSVEVVAQIESVERGGPMPYALIDFDLASPGARIYDVAYAAWTWVPLFSDRDSITLGWHSPDRPRRLRLFADAYGLIPRDRHRLVGTIRARIVDHVEGIRRMAAAGEPAFVRIVHKGHLRRPMRDLRLIDLHPTSLSFTHAVSDPTRPAAHRPRD